MTPTIRTVTELMRWLAAAEFGARIAYHTGSTGSLLNASENGVNELSKLARELRQLDERGFVFLVQRKVGDGLWQWIAQRSSRRLR